MSVSLEKHSIYPVGLVYYCWYVECDILEDASYFLTNVTRLKSDLTNIIEPDFGLSDQLLFAWSLEVQSRRKYDDIRGERRVANTGEEKPCWICWSQKTSVTSLFCSCTAN